MRKPEKLDWSRNAHLENIMFGFCQTCEGFWQSGRADGSAEWWLSHLPVLSSFSAAAAALWISWGWWLWCWCQLPGAVSVFSSKYWLTKPCTIFFMDFMDWQTQRLEPESASSLLDHVWVHGSQAREDERGQACFSTLPKYPCFSGMKFCGLSHKPMNKLKLFRIYWTPLR